MLQALIGEALSLLIAYCVVCARSIYEIAILASLYVAIYFYNVASLKKTFGKIPWYAYLPVQTLQIAGLVRLKTGTNKYVKHFVLLLAVQSASVYMPVISVIAHAAVNCCAAMILGTMQIFYPTGVGDVACDT